MRALKKQFKHIEQSDVMFVVTVPAIWNDAAKQFMREAAVAVRRIIIAVTSRPLIYVKDKYYSNNLIEKWHFFRRQTLK